MGKWDESSCGYDVGWMGDSWYGGDGAEEEEKEEEGLSAGIYAIPDVIDADVGDRSKSTAAATATIAGAVSNAGVPYATATVTSAEWIPTFTCGIGDGIYNTVVCTAGRIYG